MKRKKTKRQNSRDRHDVHDVALIVPPAGESRVESAAALKLSQCLLSSGRGKLLLVVLLCALVEKGDAEIFFFERVIYFFFTYFRLEISSH